MSNLIKPIIFYPPYMCMECGSDQIEIFDYFNNPLNYKKGLQSIQNGYMPSEFNKRVIYKMKCRACGKVYLIKWRDGIPYPNENERLVSMFLSDFKDSKKVFNPMI